ncbi:MAG: GDP-mannose 4,6-dehydratase [Pyrinomonadaceae bacterium]
MNETNTRRGAAVVVGAAGQDGYFLVSRLLAEGWQVHAVARRPEALSALAEVHARRGRLQAHALDLCEPSPLFDLIAAVQPAEVYNLAGQSSVSRSFADPLTTWRTNAAFVAELLECVRLSSPETRLYQASSTDMFGGAAGGTVRYHEESALNPQSPYASAKAAAHLLCRSYREAYGVRVACGILSNHESHRRPAQFLTRKITDHVRALQRLAPGERPLAPLAMGNLKIRRDWGFAPDYVEGMQLIVRQIEVRAARALAPAGDAVAVESGDGAVALDDEGRSYRDYVLGTGQTHAVWELVNAAFSLGGFPLEWRLEGDDPTDWGARFSATGEAAVVVDEKLLRPADPRDIEVDVARARRELGWSPRTGLDVFLADMLDVTGRFPG